MIHDSKEERRYSIYELFSEDREEWNNFVAQNAGSFLQSFEWGAFQESLGRRVRRYVIVQRNEEKYNTNLRILHKSTNHGWIGIALVVKHQLPFGKSYLYCPRGPVIESGIRNQELWERILGVLAGHIKEVGKKENAIFLRIDPEILLHDSRFIIPNSLGLRKAAKEVQPKQTIIADLTKSEEELLQEMHPKTRYNIRVAEKRGLKIMNHETRNMKQFEEFWSLLQETAKRDGFHTHPKEYYQKQLAFSGIIHSLTNSAIAEFVRLEIEFSNELFLAEYQGKIIAGAIVNFWGKRATYLHGASDYSSRNLMAPYLLHWEIMKEAKRRGFEEYDFWGIDEKKWPGLTRFKKGFGGQHIEYEGAYDFIFQKFWHTLYRVGTWRKRAR